jgi:exodeoxyribonuclease-5
VKKLSIELTKKQVEGLNIAVQRYNEHKPWTCISGYAGSGKSTLIKFIIAALGVDPEKEVCYIAFTGKAATVLKQKGCPNAVTAHKLLYNAKPMPNGTYKFIPKSTLEGDYKVIVVDEISMLPKPLWELLVSHGIYIIATGDPGQLPTIDKDMDNHVLDNPHIFLDEIMR